MLAPGGGSSGGGGGIDGGSSGGSGNGYGGGDDSTLAGVGVGVAGGSTGMSVDVAVALTNATAALTMSMERRSQLEAELTEQSAKLTVLQSQLETAEKENDRLRKALDANSAKLSEAQRMLAAVEEETEIMARDWTEETRSLEQQLAEEKRAREEEKVMAELEMAKGLRVISERLSLMLTAASPVSGQPDATRSMEFVRMVGRAVPTSCGDGDHNNGGGWTILQQWPEEDTVALPVPDKAADTMEKVLLLLYLKQAEMVVDDEVLDLVGRLVGCAETAVEVRLSVMRDVIKGYLEFAIAATSTDYYGPAIAFMLRQLGRVLARRCRLYDLSEIEQHVGGLLSDVSTPLGALSSLLDGGGLADLIREEKQVYLPGGVKLDVRYCRPQDVAVILLPGSNGFAWVLELVNHGARRVDLGRVTVFTRSQHMLKAITGCEDVILPGYLFW